MNAFVRLLRVELHRYLRRRAVQVLMAACIAVPAVIGLITIIDTHPPSNAEVAVQTELTEDESYDDEYYDEEYYDTLRLDDEQSDSGAAVASVLAILLLLAGTTFTGHDWNSASVSNQLLFEPRRARVWAAKALVVTGGALLAAAAVMTTYWAVLGLVASSRGTLADGDLLDALQMGWRAAGVAAAASLLGFVLTMLFRSTVATIGLLLGAAVAGSLLLAALGVSERWNPAVNLVALIDDGTTYYSEDECYDDDPHGFDSGYCEEQVTFGDASRYLGSFLLLGGLASFVSFGRRDVP